MTFAVTGGTGALGRHVVAALPGARSVSRSSGTDLVRGKGLGALRADVVVHCATSFRHEVDMARAVLASKPAHLVYISIVGCNEVPLPYYKQKLAAERLIINSGTPYTILRATQFHSLLRKMFDNLSKLPLMLVPAFRFQPIDEAEVGLELAALAQSAPTGLAPEMGGPEVREAADFARTYLAATGKKRTLVPLKTPGATYRAYRAGGNLTPGRAVGTRTFADYLTG
ncbi:SDR family oxidoreductase [Lentzea sp. NPDC051838]|uniref:SDR family oxidoreductase n=1 Tax=Lentzea sp. NPDC051838 TaxID=3154849 RepID=UPI0034178978